MLKFRTEKPIEGRKFEAKLIFADSDVFFSADCYRNPSEKFPLEFSEENEVYELKGFDGRDEIILWFSFIAKPQNGETANKA